MLSPAPPAAKESRPPSPASPMAPRHAPSDSQFVRDSIIQKDITTHFKGSIIEKDSITRFRENSLQVQVRTFIPAARPPASAALSSACSMTSVGLRAPKPRASQAALYFRRIPAATAWAAGTAVRSRDRQQARRAGNNKQEGKVWVIPDPVSSGRVYSSTT